MALTEEPMKEAYFDLVRDFINHIRETGVPIIDLSAKSGVAPGSISGFLNNKIRIRLDTAIALATATNCQLVLVKKQPSTLDDAIPSIDTVKIGYINRNGMEIIGHKLQKDRSQRQYRACIMKCMICAEEKTIYPSSTYQHYCKRCRNLPLIDRIRNHERLKHLLKNKDPIDFSAPE